MTQPTTSGERALHRDAAIARIIAEDAELLRRLGDGLGDAAEDGSGSGD